MKKYILYLIALVCFQVNSQDLSEKREIALQTLNNSVQQENGRNAFFKGDTLVVSIKYKEYKLSENLVNFEEYQDFIYELGKRISYDYLYKFYFDNIIGNTLQTLYIDEVEYQIYFKTTPNNTDIRTTYVSPMHSSSIKNQTLGGFKTKLKGFKD